MGVANESVGTVPILSWEAASEECRARGLMVGSQLAVHDQKRKKVNKETSKSSN